MVAPLSTRLNRKIEIRRATIAKVKGEQEKTWSTIATVAAEAICQNTRDAVIASALQGVTTYKVTIRWRPDLLTTDQLRLGSQDLAIRGDPYDPDGRREQLVMLADTAATEA